MTMTTKQLLNLNLAGSYQNTKQHVFVHHKDGWSEEGVITDLKDDGWFNLTMGNETSRWNLSQVSKIEQD